MNYPKVSIEQSYVTVGRSDNFPTLEVTPFSDEAIKLTLFRRRDVNGAAGESILLTRQDYEVLKAIIDATFAIEFK